MLLTAVETTSEEITDFNESTLLGASVSNNEERCTAKAQLEAVSCGDLGATAVLVDVD